MLSRVLLLLLSYGAKKAMTTEININTLVDEAVYMVILTERIKNLAMIIDTMIEENSRVSFNEFSEILSEIDSNLTELDLSSNSVNLIINKMQGVLYDYE